MTIDKQAALAMGEPLPANLRKQRLERRRRGGAGDKPQSTKRIEPVSAAQVKSRDVDFLYRDLFPRGFISLIAGNPSKGKSLLSYLIAAEAQDSAVLFASYEETREHVWRPRLEAAGAPLERCFMHPEIQFSTNPADAALLAELLEQTGAALLIIDPIMNHTQRSIYHPTWLRKDLRAMEELISKYQVAAIFLHHVVKAVNVNKHPLAAVTGSLSGLPAIARSVYLFSPSPEDENVLVLANAEKHNLAAVPPSYAFQIETRRVPMLSATGERALEKDAPYLECVGETHITARDLLPVLRGSHRPASQLQAAMEFLIAALEDGPVPVKELKARAVTARVASRTMQRAADELGIAKEPKGWELPDALTALMEETKSAKVRLSGEHAETHLTREEIAALLAVPNSQTLSDLAQDEA